MGGHTLIREFLVFQFAVHKIHVVEDDRQMPSKHFKVGSTLFLGWYYVATSHNVKSTLKQPLRMSTLKFTA